MSDIKHNQRYTCLHQEVVKGSTLGKLVMCREKLVQEAQDTLLDNGIQGQPMGDGPSKFYKPFSNTIEGK